MKTVNYITGLGNELYLTLKHGLRFVFLLLRPVKAICVWPLRLAVRIATEMYQQKPRTPLWKRATAIANPRVDIIVGAAVVVLGLLSVL